MQNSLAALVLVGAWLTARAADRVETLRARLMSEELTSPKTNDEELHCGSKSTRNEMHGIRRPRLHPKTGLVICLDLVRGIFAKI